MRILITGGLGMLGREFRSPNHIFQSSSKEFLNVCSLKSLNNAFCYFKPHVVIHCAAYTNVNGCEGNPHLAFKINAMGTANVAAMANQYRAKMVYISTDYVFEGNTEYPYHEYRKPNPINVYGQSKYQGELAVQSLCPDHLIVRTSSLFGNGKCFPRLILENRFYPIPVVDDQVSCPTYTPHLAKAILRVIEDNISGIIHLTNGTPMSWYVFAKQFLPEEYLVCSHSWASDRPKRPHNSILVTLTEYKLPALSEAIKEWKKK